MLASRRYQLAVPGTGKLVFCTRTVPEMSKALEELRLVLESESVLGAVLVITSLDWYVWNGFADFEYVYSPLEVGFNGVATLLISG